MRSVRSCYTDHDVSALSVSAPGSKCGAGTHQREFPLECFQDSFGHIRRPVYAGDFLVILEEEEQFLLGHELQDGLVGLHPAQEDRHQVDRNTVKEREVGTGRKGRERESKEQPTEK